MPILAFICGWFILLVGQTARGSVRNKHLISSSQGFFSHSQEFPVSSSLFLSLIASLCHRSPAFCPDSFPTHPQHGTPNPDGTTGDILEIPALTVVSDIGSNLLVLIGAGKSPRFSCVCLCGSFERKQSPFSLFLRIFSDRRSPSLVFANISLITAPFVSMRFPSFLKSLLNTRLPMTQSIMI